MQQCPLCGSTNACENLTPKSNQKCWCMEPNIRFQVELINQALNTTENISCICKSCAQRHHSNCTLRSL
ncbi:cysteine-rich CWC family protein [Aliiglaciecola lipolytica]|nr:cysteine-rich CWC family protein [Aliiglaciecola lipolytica]